MSIAFWSIKLTKGKTEEVQPPEGYVLNLQQAAISGKGHGAVKVTTVSVEGDKLEALICTLRTEKTEQVNMNLVFGYDVPVKFAMTGSSEAEVYLSGYFQPGPEDEEAGG
jgi:hypothetical protein